MNVTIEKLCEIMIQAEITAKNPAELDPNLPLRQQGIDSLDMATFVFFLEEALGKSVSERLTADFYQAATANAVQQQSQP